MPPIRIAIASLPQLLREIIVDALSCEHDMELVGEVPGTVQLRRLVRKSAVDVAIVACETPEADALLRCINGLPVTLLAITDEGHSGALYELRPSKTELGELSPSGLVNAIRQVSGKPAA